ncbi:MAG: hypothetical protein M1837_002170 [Sclerophora amabilis]|nr:MAG: hypothetical protein M1837_002170 [Sclerophora amabilis]
MGNILSQCYPPPPTLTATELPDLSGKVFLITGASSGVGFELAKLLYQRHGTVYVAARSLEKAERAITDIKAAFPLSDGRIEFLHLDLDDLTIIKKSAHDFMGREQRLDVLWNNAGVMIPPSGSVTKQGYELQLGTNCVAPFLFTKLLLPILKKTAAESAPGSVRIAWASSITIDLISPTGGMDLDDLAYARGSQRYKYAQSKVGNYFLGSEFARRLADDGIISVTFNPGNLSTALMRHAPTLLDLFMKPFLHLPIFGAYTELYAGLSPDIPLHNYNQNHNHPHEHGLVGMYIMPWGRIQDPSRARPDILASLMPATNALAAAEKGEERGTSKACRFWEWCERETEGFC